MSTLKHSPRFSPIDATPISLAAPPIRSDEDGLRRAVIAARASTPGRIAVGAVFTDQDGYVVATGSRFEITDPETGVCSVTHAEQVALNGIDPELLRGGTAYLTLEPCSRRSHGATPCVELLIDSGVRRVVFLEQDFAQLGLTGEPCRSTAILREHGIEVANYPVPQPELEQWIGEPIPIG